MENPIWMDDLGGTSTSGTSKSSWNIWKIHCHTSMAWKKVNFWLVRLIPHTSSTRLVVLFGTYAKVGPDVWCITFAPNLWCNLLPRAPAGLHVVGHFSHLVHGTEFVQDWHASLRFISLWGWHHSQLHGNLGWWNLGRIGQPRQPLIHRKIRLALCGYLRSQTRKIAILMIDWWAIISNYRIFRHSNLVLGVMPLLRPQVKSSKPKGNEGEVMFGCPKLWANLLRNTHHLLIILIASATWWSSTLQTPWAAKCF